MTPSSTKNFRIAVVGAGPTGFYTVEALLNRGVDVSVDLFERLPVPFGLVRYGVAPDHQKIKNVTKVFERILQDPRVRYLGHVHIGTDIRIDEMPRFYHACVITTGAQTDRRLNIRGEDLPGSHTATEFVGWYNGHPDYVERTFDLNGTIASIIGQGNVAVDVARMLAKSVDELKQTDITQAALDVLSTSKIKLIRLIGRRGPVQAAFTPTELRELIQLPDVKVVVDPAVFELNDASREELNDPANAQARKNWELMQSLKDPATGGGPARREIHLEFYKSPCALLGTDHVTQIELERNRLVGPPGGQKAQGTGEHMVWPTDVVFRSIGYKGVPIPGLPFDDAKGVIPNERGRILENGAPKIGWYCAGWIKRGAKGVIGTNKPCAVETVQSLWADADRLNTPDHPAPEDVDDLLTQRGVKVVRYDHWRRLDAEEIRRGQAKGKPREKFTTVEEMLHAAGL